MSMLIIGVNPPKSCYACSWYNKVECPVNDGRYYYRMQRHPNCPLTELPPHGRLIDADELVRIWTGAKIYGSIKPIVDARPTVIEAEGETE